MLLESTDSTKLDMLEAFMHKAYMEILSLIPEDKRFQVKLSLFDTDAHLYATAIEEKGYKGDSYKTSVWCTKEINKNNRVLEITLFPSKD